MKTTEQINVGITRAWYAGAASLLLFLLTGLFMGFAQMHELGGYLRWVALGVSVVTSAAYVLYVYGFALLGEKYEVPFLRQTSFVLCGLALASAVTFAASVVSNGTLTTLSLGGTLLGVLGSAAEVAWGAALLRLRPEFGRLAEVGGWMDIVSGLIGVALSVLYTDAFSSNLPLLFIWLSTANTILTAALYLVKMRILGLAAKAG